MSELPAGLPEALEQMAAAQTLLVALDFDGVLAPLVEHADDARPLPGSAAAVRELASLPNTFTAMVSGRALDSLRRAATPEPETLLIGSHGAEAWTGPDAEPLQLTQEQDRLLDRARAAVEEIIDSHPGTWMETKPAGVVLHTRSAADDVAAAATEAARARLTAIDGVQVTDGKRVLETSVVHSNKGEGIRTLRTLTGATAVLFAGDDVTDENGFAALLPGDLGIKIGPDDTRASFRVQSPEAFTGVLETLLELRRHRG